MEDFNTYNSPDYDFDDNDFVEVYNEDLSHLLYNESHRPFNVSCYIKDVHFEEFGDDKFIIMYQNFDIIDIPPKNHFFFNILMHDELRSKLEKQVEFYTLYYLKEHQKNYLYLNNTTYKGGLFPKKDEVNVGVFTKLNKGVYSDEEAYLQAHHSFKNSKIPEQSGVTRINVLKGATLYKKIKGENDRWNVSTIKICDRWSQGAKIVKMNIKNDVKAHFTAIYRLLKEFTEGIDLQQHDQQIEMWINQFKPNNS